MLSQHEKRLRVLAEDAVRQVFSAGRGTSDAERALRKTVAESPVYRDALVCELLDKAVRMAIRVAEASCGREATRAFQGRAKALGAERVWLEHRLRSGRCLKHACRPELVSESRQHFGQAREHLTTAKFFKAIAASLPNDHTPVEDVLFEGQLRNLERLARQFGRGTAPAGEMFTSAFGADCTSEIVKENADRPSAGSR